MERFVNYDKMKIFEICWAKFDPKGKGFIEVSNLMELLLDLGAPMGLEKEQARDFKFLKNSSRS